jgi:4-amino-4-deoxychorismate lyase
VGKIFLNGAIVSESEGTISPFDRGFLYGDGLFETMRTYDGRVHLLRRHLARLIEGARHIGLSLPSEDSLREAIHATVAANGPGDMVVRLTVSRGPAVGTLSVPAGGDAATLLVTTRGIPARSSGRDDNALITLAARRMPPELGVPLKSLNYLTSAVSERAVIAAGAGEGVLLSPEGWVAEGGKSNLFCVTSGVLHTPPLTLGILPGITRGRVVEIAAAGGIDVRESLFPAEFLLSADEVMYTNSVREIVPVTSLDGMEAGGGRPGPVTLRLLRAYRGEAPNEEL